MSEPKTDPFLMGEPPHRRLERLWEQEQRPDVYDFLAAAGVTGAAEVAAALAVDQWRRRKAGERVPAEDYLGRYPQLAEEAEAALELIYGELLVREELGERPDAEEYLRRFPRWADRLRQQFAIHRALAPGDLPQTLPHPNSQCGDLAPPPGEGGPPPAAGRRPPEVAGYEILGELGQGGMGIVYKARQLRLKRLAALKMIKAGLLALPAELDRFRREDEAVARLQHPNIVQIYEIGEHAGGPFLSLEFVSGGSLAERLRGEPQPPREAAHLVETLARAAHYAHQQGVVHRDLKPANVLLSGEWPVARGEKRQEASSVATRHSPLATVPKITDFGLAKQLDADQGQTQSGMVMGTPGYMAPEQAAGRTKEVGPAADIWALGAILYECLTGGPPFRADTPMDALLHVLNDDPVPPRRLRPGIPRDLETIALKCLRKEPGRRYVSAADLADDLARFLNHEPIRARPISPWERGLRWARRRAAIVLTVLLVFLALGSAAGGVWLWLRWQDEQEQGSEARRRAEERGRAEARLTVGYFANMTRRRGVPEGVGPLTEEEARRRYTAYKVSRRGGVVERVDVLNTPESFHRWNPLAAFTGEGDDNSAVAHSHRLTRDERGQLVEETAHDAQGKLLWKLHYPSGGLARYSDGKLFADSADAAQTVYLRFAWDENGFVRAVWWVDRSGQRRPNPHGVSGVRVEHDSRGLRKRITYLDLHSRPMLGGDRTATRTMLHDPRANPVEEACFGVQGQPVRCAGGYHKWKARHDEHGNQIELAFLDADGKPAVGRYGYHRYTCCYDGRGNMIESQTFGADGRPVVSTAGYARLTQVYDAQGIYQGQSQWVVDTKGGYVPSRRLNARGKILEQAYHAADGRPMRHADGVHRWTAKYDERGNQTEVACFDRDGKPTAHKDGWHGWKARHDERGNMLEFICFGLDGRPTANAYGVHRWTARYDERNKRIEWSYFGLDGKPVVAKAGYTRLTNAYDAQGTCVDHREWVLDSKGDYTLSRRLDARGKILEQVLFTPDGRPRRHADGHYRWTGRYDERGNPIEEAYFDREGKPTLVRNGFHLYKARFDERGNRLEGKWFGVDGEPVLFQPDGMHSLVARYDEHGREREVTWFGVDGRPVVRKVGEAARRTQRYDPTGTCVEKAFYVLDSKGGFVLRLREDGRGKILERAFFTDDGKPILSSAGCHRWTARYDDRGNQLDGAHFGLDGKPMLLPDGYHRWSGRYDDRGRRQEVAYFGIDGKPVLYKDGYQRWTERHDERGKLVESVYFGLDGKPVVTKAGYARLTRAYDAQGEYAGQSQWVPASGGGYALVLRLDARGKRLEEAFFTEEGKPKLAGNYHRATTRYDPRGNWIEIAFYGVGNKRILMPKGYHKVTARYDDRNNRTELAWFGIKGEPLMHKADGYHKRKTGYDGGGRLAETAYFGTDSRPMLSKNGYARLANVYDDKGRLTDEVAYDLAGKPLALQSVIQKVEVDSQAERLGLQVGDVLLTYNGKGVRSPAWLAHERKDEPADGPARALRARRGDRAVAVQVSPGPFGFTLLKRAAPRPQSSDPKKAPPEP